MDLWRVNGSRYYFGRVSAKVDSSAALLHFILATKSLLFIFVTTFFLLLCENAVGVYFQSLPRAGKRENLLRTSSTIEIHVGRILVFLFLATAPVEMQTMQILAFAV